MILFFAAINLVFTTGRAAIMSLILGGGFYFFFVRRKYSQLRGAILYLLICAIVIAGFSLSDELNFFPGNPIPGIVEGLLSSRGASTEHRVTVYQYTIQGWLERPFFGWGTERDIPDFKFPAGSHSYYLSILYRQGIFGLLVFILLLFSIWKTTRPIRKNEFKIIFQKEINFLEIGRWVFIVMVFDGLTTVPITDILTMTLLWLIISLLISTRDLCLRTNVKKIPIITA
jgi:O-antigen ligase